MTLHPSSNVLWVVFFALFGLAHPILTATVSASEVTQFEGGTSLGTSYRQTMTLPLPNELIDDIARSDLQWEEVRVNVDECKMPADQKSNSHPESRATEQ